MSKIYKGDEGTVLEVDVGEDISTATTTELKVLKPDGAPATWVGSVNGLVNTQIDYTIVNGDLDQAGKYRLQAYVVTVAWDGRGETVELMVYDEFD